MNPMMIGTILFGVAALGFVGHVLRFLATRSLSFVVLWLIAPLAAAMVAFLLAPTSLLTVSLGSAAFVLAVVTLLATLVVPAITDGRTGSPEAAESGDQAA